MEIKKGQKFRCIKDVVMDSGKVEYHKGFTYTSAIDGCITDDSGDDRHEWPDDIETWEHFELYEPGGNGDKVVGKDYREFETGSRRDSDAGKPRVADLKAYTRLRFGYHMLIGSEKYGEGNFELGQPNESTLKSIHRHLAQFELGDDSEDHMSAVLFGVQMIMLEQQRTGVSIKHYYTKHKEND